MGFFSRIFGRNDPVALPSIPEPFSTLSQSQLNNLASILPMTLKLVRTPSTGQGIFIGDIDDADVKLVRSLSDEQFDELTEIQEIFRQAQNEEDATEKLNYYKILAKKAPWHPIAFKSLGVCYYIAGDRNKAYQYLKQAIQLAPNDENICANFQRVESEL